jgi:hypothetical protein
MEDDMDVFVDPNFAEDFHVFPNAPTARDDELEAGSK